MELLNKFNFVFITQGIVRRMRRGKFFGSVNKVIDGSLTEQEIKKVYDREIGRWNYDLKLVKIELFDEQFLLFITQNCKS
ncbi:MAG: hypothetical protein N2114_01245 [Candidatus Goldbacteria bacterium]|nr:hypothetical protein [Candidatus Goldiibacteriota bacterium]